MSQSIGAGLLGIEIGRSRVRVALLDGHARRLRAAAERPMAKAGGPRDPIEQEFATRSAIEAAVDRLGLGSVPLAVGVTIGFSNCGVGSGPALREWLDSLSDELDEPVLYTGHDGVSYAPVGCVDFVRRVFEPTGLHLERVELAPVAAARVLTSIRSGAITLGSGVAWSARLLNRQVLEAFETIEGGFDDELQIIINGAGEALTDLEGLEIDEAVELSRTLSAGALAPAAGVAVGLVDEAGGNLLTAQVAGAMIEVAAPASSAAVSVPSAAVRAPVGPRPVDPQPADGPWFDDPVDEGLPAPPPIDPYLDDDLGSIEDDVLADRVSQDTHRLRRIPPDYGHSRSTPVSGRPANVEPSPERRTRPDRRPAPDAGIEAFAPREEVVDDGRFHVSDFLLGALLMLAIVLAVALVVV